jgi:hypothetical protein
VVPGNSLFLVAVSRCYLDGVITKNRGIPRASIAGPLFLPDKNSRNIGGSRVTFATGMAVVEASKKVVNELRARAAMIWDVDVDGVNYQPIRDGCEIFFIPKLEGG